MGLRKGDAYALDASFFPNAINQVALGIEDIVLTKHAAPFPGLAWLTPLLYGSNYTLSYRLQARWSFPKAFDCSQTAPAPKPNYMTSSLFASPVVSVSMTMVLDKSSMTVTCY